MAYGDFDMAAVQAALDKMRQAGLDPAMLASNPLSTNANNQISTEDLIRNRLSTMQLAAPLSPPQQAFLQQTAPQQPAGSAGSQAAFPAAPANAPANAPMNYDDPATMINSL